MAKKEQKVEDASISNGTNFDPILEERLSLIHI